MKKGFTESELAVAYEICILIKSHSDNVLASGGEYAKSKSDLEWSRKAGKFIKAYERVNAMKLAKSKKAGYMGEALLKLQDIHKTISDISK